MGCKHNDWCAKYKCWCDEVMHKHGDSCGGSCHKCDYKEDLTQIVKPEK